MSLDELRGVRVEKLERLKKLNLDPFPAKVWRTHTLINVIDNFEELELSGKAIVVAGRIMAKREHGGSLFLDLVDESGQIQAYIKKDILGDAEFKNIDEIADIGDFFELFGKAFKTKRGEKSVVVEKFRILAKSLLPLPEKWHGLKDTEERYRRRYLDLLMNQEVRVKFKKRSRIINGFRNYLLEKDFVEVTTPTLQSLYGGASARPFKTHLNALDVDMYLRIAPELYLKRLLVGGMENVFEFTTNFRNEGIDREHNPEFSALEFYSAYHDYEWSMELVEDMIGHVVDSVFGKSVINYEDKVLDFKKPFARASYESLFKKFTDIEIADTELDEIINRLKKEGVNSDKLVSKEQAMDELFKKLIRPKLWEPIFVTDFPKNMLPLAKLKADDENTVEAFQLYAAGLELCKAFTELNDPIDQRQRFEAQENMRAKGDEEAQQMDEDYIEAMEYGMPPNTGVGIGLDRLIALLTNSHSIREVILFPLMRPKEKSD